LTSSESSQQFSILHCFVALRRLATTSLTVLLLAAASALLSCQGLGHNSAPPDSSPLGKATSQVLYLVGDGTISTYAVDANALTFSAVGNPVNLVPAGSLLQFVPASNQFIYVLWSDVTGQQHLSVYATDSSGVPQTPAVQTLDASALYQFNIDPTAHFVYMMQISNSAAGYSSTVHLFHVDAMNGTLLEDTSLQGVYGPFTLCPALLYGFSADGKELYLNRQDLQGPFYEQRELNSQTGSVGPDVILYQPAGGWSGSNMLVIGKRLMANQYRSPGGVGSIDVLPLVPNAQEDLFCCTRSMLNACETAANVQIDPSGNYFFLSDPASQKIHVAKIALDEKRLDDTGSFIPMTAQIPGFAFSPDGTLVYGILASDMSVHVYSFNPATGQLAGGGSSLPLANNYGFCPAALR
jgi:Lactonase, 7-bladed beta-propeller